MADSLQEQLLKSGLANADKAKKLAKEKRKAAKLARGTGRDLVDENKTNLELQLIFNDAYELHRKKSNFGAQLIR